MRLQSMNKIQEIWAQNTTFFENKDNIWGQDTMTKETLVEIII